MEFEQILKLVDHVSASHLESFCYESDGVKLTLNNKIAPVIIPGTMQNNILSGAETGEKGFVYGEKYSISEQAPDRKMADKELSASEKKQASDTMISNGEPTGNTVKSPLVGTFYAAPAEDAESFVKVGDRVEKGQTLEYWISDTTAELVQSLEGKETPSVYLAGNSALLQTAGPEMYQSTLIEHAGGVNAASEITDTYWADTSYEQILSWNPDYIILAADADYDVDSVLNDSALADCTAVKEGHVYQIPSDIEALDSPVPASFLGSYYVASVLHPDVVTEDDFKTAEKNFYETFYGFTPESAN